MSPVFCSSIFLQHIYKLSKDFVVYQHVQSIYFSATEHTDKIWVMVSFPKQLNLRILTYLHCCRFAGDGKASYIDR